LTLNMEAAYSSETSVHMYGWGVGWGCVRWFLVFVVCYLQ
jgi:hypothetical protein